MLGRDLETLKRGRHYHGLALHLKAQPALALRGGAYPVVGDDAAFDQRGDGLYLQCPFPISLLDYVKHSPHLPFELAVIGAPKKVRRNAAEEPCPGGWAMLH
jgi:hypothetical protein